MSGPAVRIPEDVVAFPLGKNLFVMRRSTETHCLLNETAAGIWRALRQRETISDDEVARAEDVVRDLVGSLLSEGLLERVPG